MIKKWKKLLSEVVYSNPWFSVRQDKVTKPDGDSGEYSVVTIHPAVLIIALNEKDEIFLIRLHRHPTDMVSVEVPAGSTDGQDALEAAKRELGEETGLRAENWEEIGQLQLANGFSNQMGYVFLARELSDIGKDEMDEEGIEPVGWRSQSEVLEMIKTGEFSDAHSVSAVLLTYLHLNKLKTKN